MGIVERKARQKERTRGAILDAARQLFVAQGYEAVTLRKIAEEIEYSPGTIYLHFKDKDEILLHLFEEGFGLLKARLDAVEEDDPIEWLRRGGRVYLDFATEQPQYYDIMFRITSAALRDKIDMSASMGPRTFASIQRAVHEATARGQIARATLPDLARDRNGREQDLHELILSHTLWAGLHGAASLLLSRKLMFHGDNLERERDTFFTSTIETMLRGLPRPRPTTQSD